MSAAPQAANRLRVIIVGAGFGGIAAAAELRRHGIDDVTLFETAAELGGTWNHNRYPGAACDVPSHLYSFSYAQRPDWTRICSPQSEILDYLKAVADASDLTRRIVVNTAVTECRWDEATLQWVVRVEGPGGPGGPAEHRADALILATGQLNQPALPRIEGLADFAGQSFHSARWNHGYDLRGRRVAVIGTGASAVQFVPAIVDQVAQLTVFQRTGNWFMPRRNSAYPRAALALFRAQPWTRQLWRGWWFAFGEVLTAMIRHPRTLGRIGRLTSTLFMRRQLRDPDVRRKAWPDYAFGCKRVLFSSTFLPALQRSHVELITDPIERMTADGPLTADGRVHEVDCIIYGTGFRTNDFMFPMQITGAGGRTLQQEWAAGAHAHLGITVAGFPAMYVMYGPNTNTSGGSIIFFLEAQARYVRQALQLARSGGGAALTVRAPVEGAYDRTVQAGFTGTAWTQCNSWYRTASGRIVANWPGYMRGYARRTRRLDPADFEVVDARADTPVG